jgi:hypothetical protein
MHVAAKRKMLHDQSARENADLSRYVPEGLAKLGDPQTAIPRIAKDHESIQTIERARQLHKFYGFIRNLLPTFISKRD